MIYAKRPKTAPASLSAAAATDEMKKATTYYKGWKKGATAYTFKQYRAWDVSDALRKLFHGKCAYCERRIEKGTREVEHYRPKGGNEDPNHPGYWWLAHSWTNLLPTCAPCNKGLHQHVVTLNMTVADVEALQAIKPSKLWGKANSFPVGAARLQASSEDHEREQPHLIDPTRTKPDAHLTWNHHTDYSIVTPRSEGGQPSIEGAETIRCLALNRVGLVEGRTAALDILKGQRKRIRDSLNETVGMSAREQALAVKFILAGLEDMRLHCSADKEYAAMATAFLIEFREEVSQWLAVHRTPDPR
jgi:uncharacterized protein (TIGR02646 family)